MAKSSLLIGLLENRFKNLVQFVVDWDKSDLSTLNGLNLNRHPVIQVHQIHTSDAYPQQPCGITITKCKFHVDSFVQNGSAPFIYPVYGVGGLPEGFSRLAAIHNGILKLHKDRNGFVYGDDRKVCGVKSGEEVAKCNMVICNPS